LAVGASRCAGESENCRPGATLRAKVQMVSSAGDRFCRLFPGGKGLMTWALRIHYGPGYRVYYAQRGAVLILLLCGGDKSTQQKDIETAKRLARETP
jgi:putative addiction module killer protein